jgi:hypothetical protein
MKKLSSIFMFLMLMAFMPLHAHAQDITTGLIGWWKLDETTGSIAYDSGSGANNGSYDGGFTAATASRGGKVGGAIEWYGNPDRINIGTPAELNNINQMTLSAWIYPRAGAIFNRIIDKNAGGTQGWQFMVNGNNAAYFYKGRSTTGGSWQSPNSSIALNEWVHIIMSYDRTNVANDAVFYLNGELVATTEVNTPVGTPGDDSITSFVIGGRTNGANSFDGLIDDVRVYNRMFTAEDAMKLYQARHPGTLKYNFDHRAPEYYNGNDWITAGFDHPINNGLVGWWKLDETSGAFIDSSGYGNDGTGAGSIDYASSGVIGYSAGFDGSPDRIDLGDISAIESVSKLTISVWMRRGAVSAPIMLEKGLDSSNDIMGINLWSNGFLYCSWHK